MKEIVRSSVRPAVSHYVSHSTSYSIIPPVNPFICPSVRLSVSQVSPSVRPSVRPSVNQSHSQTILLVNLRAYLCFVFCTHCLFTRYTFRRKSCKINRMSVTQTVTSENKSHQKTTRQQANLRHCRRRHYQLQRASVSFFLKKDSDGKMKITMTDHQKQGSSVLIAIHCLNLVDSFVYSR